jgi:transposase
VEDWAEIRRLRLAEGLPIKMIARTLGVSRNTVRSALAADGPPRYERKPAGSAVDAFEPRIREQLRAVPRTSYASTPMEDQADAFHRPTVPAPARRERNE